ncbi:MAG: hypothetical protein IPK29_07155 [Betaproteobacteria bacterium]|nr:hypothetical protein [Betaproteobacteria bacterium]
MPAHVWTEARSGSQSRELQSMNNADLIVRILRSAGIRHGFGVPSGNVLPLMEAMRTGGVEFVLTAHEARLHLPAMSAAGRPASPGCASQRWGRERPTSLPALAVPFWTGRH